MPKPFAYESFQQDELLLPKMQLAVYTCDAFYGMSYTIWDNDTVDVSNK